MLGSLDRRLYGIGAYTHLDAPWALQRGASRLSERSGSSFTPLSELRFVSDDDPVTTGPKDTEPPPCSPMDFAPREDTTPLQTPIEEPVSRFSFLSFSTSDSSSFATNEELDQLAQSETDTKGVGKRPLPEVPGQAQSRPLPTRPMVTIPTDQSSRTPLREFVQGSSKDLLTPARPSSDSGHGTWGSSVEEKRQEVHDLTPKYTTPVHRTPATTTSLSLASTSSLHPPSPPPPSLETVALIPKTPTPHYSRDLVSPTSIDLVTAAGLPIVGENGEEILFGALFRDRKAVVIFIRYFWCLFCDDYVHSITKSVTPEILKNKGVDLVVIANGAPDMIKMYKSTPLFTFVAHIFDEADPIGLRDAQVTIQGVHRSILPVARRSRVI